MFTLTIETDSAAFDEEDRDDAPRTEELARILRKLADQIAGRAAGFNSGNIHDDYGNNCGTWELS